jgi:hypothetical protein
MSIGTTRDKETGRVRLKLHVYKNNPENGFGAESKC